MDTRRIRDFSGAPFLPCWNDDKKKSIPHVLWPSLKAGACDFMPVCWRGWKKWREKMEGSSGGRRKDEWLRVRLLIYFSCAALSWTVSLRRQDEPLPTAPPGGSQPTWVAERLSSSPDCHIRDCYRYRKQLNACGRYQENSPIYGWWLTRGCVLCVSICSLCKEPSLISQKPFPSCYLWHQSVPFLSPTASCCSSCLRCLIISGRTPRLFVCLPLGFLSSGENFSL